MSKSRFICGLVAACMCFSALTCFAGTTAAQKWPSYKGSMRSYFSARLPLPFVIYKFNAEGTLVGMFIASKFQKDPGNVHPTAQDFSYNYDKMRQFIISGHVKQPSQHALASYAASFKEFLLDQGYELGDFIDHTKSFTLLLAETDISKTSCAFFKKSYLGNVNTVRNAVHDASATNGYAVRQIQLGGPGFKFGTCPHGG